MGLSRTIRLLTLGLVLVCTAGCDQVTKHFARTELGGRAPILCPGRFMELTLAENPGAFLSLGAALPPAVRNAASAGVAVGLVFLLGFLVQSPQLRRSSFLGLALICSGGMSNLIDRFTRHGLVTDFAVLRVGPLHTGIFNLADLVLVVGVLILIARSWASGFPERKPSN